MADEEESTSDIDDTLVKRTSNNQTDFIEGEEQPDEITEAPDNNALRAYTAILTRGAAQIAGMVAVGANPIFAGLGAGLVATMSFFCCQRSAPEIEANRGVDRTTR